MKVPEFACGANAYLNNASVSPMPVASIRAVSEFLTKYSQIGPDSAESEPFVTETLRQTRKRISAIIGCQPDEIILTQSTTDGINAVARGLPHQDDAHMLIRGMEHEHHSNFYPWVRRANGTQQSLKIDENGFFDMRNLLEIIRTDKICAEQFRPCSSSIITESCLKFLRHSFECNLCDAVIIVYGGRFPSYS